jgi:hypothetical protein
MSVLNRIQQWHRRNLLLRPMIDVCALSHNELENAPLRIYNVCMCIYLERSRLWQDVIFSWLPYLFGVHQRGAFKMPRLFNRTAPV